MPPEDYDSPYDAPPRRGESSAVEPDVLPYALDDRDCDDAVSRPAAAVPVAPPVALVWCRRCGETSEPVDRRCPWCDAWLVGKPPRRVRARVVEDEEEEDWHNDRAFAIPVRRPRQPLVPPIAVVIVSYVALLGTSVAFLIVAIARGMTTEEDVYAGTAVVEAIDTVLALFGLALVWKAARQRLPEGTMALTWVSAVPVLIALLCLNLLYITFLRELFRPFGAAEPERMKLTLLTFLLICVQPAIVEEVFFRQMTLGVLRRSMNVHLAVWLTAGLFAFAHLFNPLGMPYLFLVGGALGYARIYGGLTLPIIMHFLHNFAVVAYEAWK